MFDFPSGADIITSSTEYATSWAGAFLPFLYVVLGVAAGVALVMFLRKKIGRAIHKMGK